MHRSIVLVASFALAVPASAQVEVLGHQRINETLGGFSGPLTGAQFFGIGVGSLGDVDGDGIGDMAVGSALEELWVLLMNADGSVKSEVRIADGAGGFTGTLSPASQNFGWSVVGLGDVDGDGVPDLAVGAPSLYTCAVCPTGSLWILFLNPDGTVKSQNEIANLKGGLPAGTLLASEGFGASVAVIGDLNGDGTKEIAVGSPERVDAGIARGAFYVLSLSSSGNVTFRTRISLGAADDLFGASLAGVGDIDGDGRPDLVAGAPGKDRGFVNRSGSVYTLLLNSTGTLKSSRRIDDGMNGFQAAGANLVDFGRGMAPLGDANGDGTPDVAVGSPTDGDGGPEHGAVWLFYLSPTGAVDSQSKISDLEGCFEVNLISDDHFGWSLARLPDLNGDGFDDLAVGAIWDGDLNTGAIYNLFLGDQLQAVSTFRNAGSNPAVYTSTSPALGSLLVMTVDAGAAGYTLARPFGFDTPITAPLGNGATLLCFDLAGNGEILGRPTLPGPVAVFELSVPMVPGLCGIRVYTQALLLGGPSSFALTNALDWIVGH